MLPGLSASNPKSVLTLALAVPLAVFAAAARADVTISSAATQNISCSTGVCAPTAATAVLNVGDLQTLLASGNVEVTTTGSGVQADNIVIDDALSWSSANTLTLDAYQSLSIDKAVAVQSQGGLTLTTDDGGTNGTLAFGHKGSVTFANLASTLTIDGTAYTLVNTIKSLASAIAANPAGAYALASNYDAGQDGTYTTVPVPTPVTGVFEGLGNAISYLALNDTTDTEVGLFAEVDTAGIIRDLAVPHANISSSASDSCAAPLVGFAFGNVIDAYASGSVVSSVSCAGGLVGYELQANISISSAATDTSAVVAGGLLGTGINGNVTQSFASGKAIGTEYAAGFIGNNGGATISNCYASGAARVSGREYTGGFDAEDGQGTTSYSYSTGRVIGQHAGSRGGFVGAAVRTNYYDDYWDTDKSGVMNRHKGAGNIKNEPGITGLTTQQLQSGLPQGFDPSIWGENRKVNDGLPYLLANLPR